MKNSCAVVTALLLMSEWSSGARLRRAQDTRVIATKEIVVDPSGSSFFVAETAQPAVIRPCHIRRGDEVLVFSDENVVPADGKSTGSDDQDEGDENVACCTSDSNDATASPTAPLPEVHAIANVTANGSAAYGSSLNNSQTVQLLHTENATYVGTNTLKLVAHVAEEDAEPVLDAKFLYGTSEYHATQTREIFPRFDATREKYYKYDWHGRGFEGFGRRAHWTRCKPIASLPVNPSRASRLQLQR